MTPKPSLWEEASPPFDIKLTRIDPYLVWALFSKWAGFGGSSNLRVMFEIGGDLGGEDPLAKFVARLIASNPLNHVTAPNRPLRYATAYLLVGELQDLVRAVDAGLVARFQLGLARTSEPDAFGKEPLSSAFDGRLSVLRIPPLPPLDTLRTAGVVDDGCCVAHEGFRDALNRTRLLLIWDQNSETSSPWQLFEEGPAYGGEVGQAVLDDTLSKYPQTGEANERPLYSEGLARPHWGDDGRTHGAGVLHTMADSMDSARCLTDPFIFVQLPTETVGDTSGGSLGVYVLDGVRYIVQRTRQVADIFSKDYASTINISLGSIAGPHDGSTITELALAELGLDSNVKIILAAGNAAGAHIHAVRAISVTKPGRFDIVAPPLNPRESYVEFWLPTDDLEVFAEDFRVRVTAPDGSQFADLTVGRAAVLSSDGLARACVVFPRKTAQGNNGTMVLLAMRSTSIPDGPVDSAPYGFWSVEIETTLERPVRVHAWVERNDILIGGRRPQQTVFVDDASSYVNDEYTLSSIANGENVTVAGAYRLWDSRVSDYCSQGPTLGAAARAGPDYFGPADEGFTQSGVLTPGFFSGTWDYVSGTSIGAPRVARWIRDGKPHGEMCPIENQNGRPVPGIKRQ